MNTEVTRILAALEQGDAHAAEELLPLVYDELRKLARARLSRERPGQTLEATALVHEAYLRLVGNDTGSGIRWEGRGHFFAAAAEAMRRILIDSARAKGARKRKGNLRKIRLDRGLKELQDNPDELLLLDQALRRFAKEEPLKTELVKLRFFAGLTLKQAASALGISPSTADRHWAYARAWLFAELRRDN